MKIKEIIEMSTDELLTKKRDLRQESLHLRLQQQSGQLEQPSRLRLLRRVRAGVGRQAAPRAEPGPPPPPTARPKQNKSRTPEQGPATFRSRRRRCRAAAAPA